MASVAIPDSNTIDWIATDVLPHEADVRRWLMQARFGGLETDDVVQEAYCRIVATPNIHRIENGRAYFFTVVRNIAFEYLRRHRIVAIDQLTAVETAVCAAEDPSPERIIMARQTLNVVQHALEQLPKHCHESFVLRKISGLSQKEVAHRLNLSESVVEKHISKALRHILSAIATTNRPTANTPTGNTPDTTQQPDAKPNAKYKNRQ